MLVGEAQELRAERLERLDANRCRKVYLFQVRSDDGFEHFRRLSKRHRELSFVLVYGDPNEELYGSYWLKVGVAREFRVSRRQQEAVMRRYRATPEDEEEWRFWEASWKLMDIAEARWESLGGPPNEALQPTSRARDGSRKSKRRPRAARG